MQFWGHLRVIPDGLKKTGGGYCFLDKGSMERCPMWSDPIRSGVRGEIPAVTDQGKSLEAGLGDQSEGTSIFVCIILEHH